MDESEWLDKYQSTQLMLRHLLSPSKLQRTKAGKRKLRLFACGVCRTIWEKLPDDRLREVVDAAERFADSEASINDLRIVTLECSSYGQFGYEPIVGDMALACANKKAARAAFMLTALSPLPKHFTKLDQEWEVVRYGVLRDIFGNPFRPVSVDPEWRTSMVVSIARQMYEARDFSLMPILSDALQDAGCENADIIDHCRGVGPHVRGCWVVDLLLGKE